jgi:hypothetical protein
VNEDKRQQFESETRLYLPLSASDHAGVEYNVFSHDDLVKFEQPTRFDASNPDIRYSKDGRILALVKNSETYLVAENISSTDDNVTGLLLHEIDDHPGWNIVGC